MLDAGRARHEQRVVHEYYAEKTEEYDEVVEVEGDEERPVGREGREQHRARDH